MPHRRTVALGRVRVRVRVRFRVRVGVGVRVRDGVGVRVRVRVLAHCERLLSSAAPRLCRIRGRGRG